MQRHGPKMLWPYLSLPPFRQRKELLHTPKPCTRGAERSTSISRTTETCVREADSMILLGLVLVTRRRSVLRITRRRLMAGLSRTACSSVWLPKSGTNFSGPGNLFTRSTRHSIHEVHAAFSVCLWCQKAEIGFVLEQTKNFLSTRRYFRQITSVLFHTAPVRFCSLYSPLSSVCNGFPFHRVMCFKFPRGWHSAANVRVSDTDKCWTKHGCQAAPLST